MSEQKHYEYGLRAVKAVLNTAAKFRESNPEHGDDEYKVILKALLDVNLPKYVSDDVPLFKGILRDMFPKVTSIFIKLIRFFIALIHYSTFNLRLSYAYDLDTLKVIP